MINKLKLFMVTALVSSAFAENSGGFSVGINVGPSFNKHEAKTETIKDGKHSKSKTNMFTELEVAYDCTFSEMFVGVAAAFGTELGKLNSKARNTEDTADIKMSSKKKFTISVKPRIGCYIPSTQISVYALVGAEYSKFLFKAGEDISKKKGKLCFVMGCGARYDLTKNIYVGVELTNQFNKEIKLSDAIKAKRKSMAAKLSAGFKFN